MPRVSCSIEGIFPCWSWRIIFCIWPNCLTSWFTAWTVVPEPAAIRFRRDPSISCGARRSCGRHRGHDRLDPVELALVDLRALELLQLPEARQHSHQVAERPELADLLHLVEEVVEAELLLPDLLLELLGTIGVDRLLGLLDEGQHVAHPEDARCHPVGMEGLELRQLLAARAVEDRLAGDAP